MESFSQIRYNTQTLFSDIIICSSGYHQRRRTDRYEENEIERYSLHLVVSGSGFYTINNTTYHLKKGDLFALFPHVDIKYEPNKKSPWKYYWIDFIGTKAKKILEQLCLSPEKPFLSTNEKLKSIERLFLNNITECKNSPECSEFITLSFLFHIISQLVVTNNPLPKKNRHLNSASVYIDMAIQYLQNNYSNPNLNLKMLASHLGINESYLSRLFNQELNISFVDYLKKIRIQAAVNLFDSGESIVQVVAATVGFSDPYYFSKVFKKLAATTPSEYIKSCKNN